TPFDPIPSTSQPPHPPHPSPPHPSPPHPSPPHPSPLHQSPPYSPPHSPPQSPPRINSLEKELKDTKQTLGNDMLKLVKKVKSLETTLKRKSKKVIISESKGEESENRGRIIQDFDDDPIVSLVRESMKEKSTDFEGGSRDRNQSNILERQQNIVKAERVVWGGGENEINTGIRRISTGRTKVDSGTASKRGQKEGKAPMVEEDIQATHKKLKQHK
ncbi:hypothetical protein Tco_0785271, partial [Tanacetum coccineum]